MPDEIAVRVDAATTTARIYRAPSGAAAATLILAHGAGAGQTSAFMVAFAAAIAALGVDVATFNFLYTERGRRLPDRGPALEACYRAAIEAVRAAVPSARRTLVIGGKSMGGRIATQVAAADPALPIAGVVLLGYPLHPPGRPETRRDKHLPRVGRPALFVQGTRDTFGTPEELEPVLATMTPRPTLHVVTGGDHSFKLAGRGMAAAQAEVYRDVQKTIADWIDLMIA
jgi:predicted alpha/beta-hydrolase family hydrolase